MEEIDRYIYTNDVTRVQELLTLDPERFLKKNKYGVSYLHKAMICNHSEIVKLIARAHPQLKEEPNVRGNLPIYYTRSQQCLDALEE
jgi:ankyrin repeat protein